MLLNAVHGLLMKREKGKGQEELREEIIICTRTEKKKKREISK